MASPRASTSRHRAGVHNRPCPACAPAPTPRTQPGLPAHGPVAPRWRSRPDRRGPAAARPRRGPPRGRTHRPGGQYSSESMRGCTVVGGRPPSAPPGRAPPSGHHHGDRRHPHVGERSGPATGRPARSRPAQRCLRGADAGTRECGPGATGYASGKAKARSPATSRPACSARLQNGRSDTQRV